MMNAAWKVAGQSHNSAQILQQLLLLVRRMLYRVLVVQAVSTIW